MPVRSEATLSSSGCMHTAPARMEIVRTRYFRACMHAHACTETSGSTFGRIHCNRVYTL